MGSRSLDVNRNINYFKKIKLKSIGRQKDCTTGAFFCWFHLFAPVKSLCKPRINDIPGYGDIEDTGKTDWS